MLHSEGEWIQGVKLNMAIDLTESIIIKQKKKNEENKLKEKYFNSRQILNFK